MGTGAFRRIHSRVSWIFRPVEGSMTVSAPCLIAQVIFSTSSSMVEARAELPMLALIFTRKRRPMIIGSVSGWFTVAGGGAGGRIVAARPAVDGRRARQLLDVAAPEDPGLTQRREPALDVEQGLGIGVGAARVVEADGRIAAREKHLAHRDADTGVPAG